MVRTVRNLVLLSLALVACSSLPKPKEAPQPPAAPANSPTPPTFRLPGDVVPKSARLELTIIPAQSSARGHVGFNAEVRRAAQVVWLNATGLQVSAATLNGQPARIVPGGEDFVGLTVDRELAPGPLAIEADFTAPIDHSRSRGLYAENEGKDAYAYTFFEATDARRAFPCFDEPSDKIPWQLTFHVQRDHVALGNAPVVSEADEPGGMKRVTLTVSKPLPSYLVAFVVGPFELVDDGVAGRVKTPVRFVVPRGRAGELAYAKEVTPRIVAALEDYFDMPYPYGKLDVAVVPRFWGTMEHPGLLAMGQPLTLIRPDQATRRRRESYANIAAHELSHYWFGDYVTMAWWDDTWLNEAQGEWLDAIITDAVEPSWRFELARVDRARMAMSSDETLAARAIRQPVKSAQDIEAAFDAETTYLKGSSVFRMFEASVGKDTWRAFIRAYVREHAWGNASAEDLFSAVRERLGPQVEAGLRSFVEQPGAPKISATLHCEGKPTLELHQSRSLPAGLVDPKQRLWTVPVCVRFGGAHAPARRACTMLSAERGELPLDGPCPQWVVTNAEGAGYYRSAIGDAGWAEELLTPDSPGARALAPTTAEKLMMISDLRAAVDRDELSIARVLALAPKVAADADPRIVRSSLELRAFHLDALDAELYARGVRYLGSLVRPLADRLGWKRRPGDTDDTHALRLSVMGIARFDEGLSAQARKLAWKWLDDRTAIDDDMVSMVLAVAAFHGDQALFDRILASARTARDRQEKQRLVSSLGGFTDPKLIAQALELVRGTEFDLRDSIGIVYRAVATRETRPQALGFLEAHLDEVLSRMRDDEASVLLGAIAGSSCDPASRDRSAALTRPRAQRVSGAELSVTRGLAESAACIATFDRQLPALRAFLLKNG
jgi:aminopeptidase N